MSRAMTSDERKVLVDALLSEIGTAEKYNRLVFELQAEIDRLRLTDAEREAIERLEDYCAKTHCVDTARTLRGLLERVTKHSAGVSEAIPEP